MEPNDMEPIPDDSIFQINEELFWLDRLPKMSARELFDRIHRLFPDHCESVLMLRRLMGEAYRRLNEADALRNAHAKLLKDYAELRVNSALLVACDDALESMDANESKESEAKK